LVRFAQRMTRALLCGTSLAFIAGLGFWFLARGLNEIVGAVVVPPTGVTVLIFGGCIVSAVAVELSEDIAEGTKTP